MRETFKVGDKVKWYSSNTWKRGTITHVVPAGQTPEKMGIKAGGGGGPRGDESYIVVGRKFASETSVELGVAPYGSKAKYWPLISLLHKLSPDSTV